MGANLALGARREERLADMAGKLGDTSDNVAFTAVDVRHREDPVALVALARERFGRLDVLVGNGGAGPVSPPNELRLDERDAMIDVKVKGISVLEDHADPGTLLADHSLNWHQTNLGASSYAC